MPMRRPSAYANGGARRRRTSGAVVEAARERQGSVQLHRSEACRQEAQGDHQD